jgi:hypothetical protein
LRTSSSKKFEDALAIFSRVMKTLLEELTSLKAEFDHMRLETALSIK